MAREDKKGTLLKLFFSMLYISALSLIHISEPTRH